MHLSSFSLLQPLFPALFTCFRVLRGKHSTLAKFAGGWGQISWCTTSAATAGDAADGDGDGDDHDDDDHLLLLLLLLLMMIVTISSCPSAQAASCFHRWRESIVGRVRWERRIRAVCGRCERAGEGLCGWRGGIANM